MTMTNSDIVLPSEGGEGDINQIIMNVKLQTGGAGVWRRKRNRSLRACLISGKEERGDGKEVFPGGDDLCGWWEECEG